MNAPVKVDLGWMISNSLGRRGLAGGAIVRVATFPPNMKTNPFRDFTTRLANARGRERSPDKNQNTTSSARIRVVQCSERNEKSLDGEIAASKGEEWGSSNKRQNVHSKRVIDILSEMD
jgi:hypothetical protein